MSDFHTSTPAPKIDEFQTLADALLTVELAEHKLTVELALAVLKREVPGRMPGDPAHLVARIMAELRGAQGTTDAVRAAVARISQVRSLQSLRSDHQE